MVLSLLSRCLLLRPFWDYVFVLYFVVRYFMLSFAIILMGKRELAALLSLSSCGDCCAALPQGAMGLSAICDCGIS